jgi:hypothetical protein
MFILSLAGEGLWAAINRNSHSYRISYLRPTESKGFWFRQLERPKTPEGLRLFRPSDDQSLSQKLIGDIHDVALGFLGGLAGFFCSDDCSILDLFSLMGAVYDRARFEVHALRASKPEKP